MRTLAQMLAREATILDRSVLLSRIGAVALIINIQLLYWQMGKYAHIRGDKVQKILSKETILIIECDIDNQWYKMGDWPRGKISLYVDILLCYQRMEENKVQ